MSILAVVGADGREWRQFGTRRRTVVGHSRGQAAATQRTAVERDAGGHRSQVHRRSRQTAGRREHGATALRLFSCFSRSMPVSAISQSVEKTFPSVRGGASVLLLRS